MNKSAKKALKIFLGVGVGVATLVSLPTYSFSSEPLAMKSKRLAGTTFTFQKLMTVDGEVKEIILDQKGKEVSARELPRVRPYILQPSLKRALKASASLSDVIRVNLALRIPSPVLNEKPQLGIVRISEKGKTQRFQLNGRRISEQRYTRIQAGEGRARGRQAAGRAKERLKFLEEFSKRHNIQLPKEMLGSLKHTLTLDLTTKQIWDLVKSGDPSISGIELWEESRDELSSAMASTAIDPWALGFASTKGDGIGIYQTESGCPNESRFSDYTRLDGSETNHARNVAGIIKGVAPDSHLYCRGGAVLPTLMDLYAVWVPELILDLLGMTTSVEIPIQVVTRSNGAGGAGNYTTTDRDWDDFVYDHMIPAFKSAGNDGDVSGEITSPGKGLNIVTVGNYDDATDTIAFDSSFVDSAIGSVKPEISAPGTNVTAGGFTMSGTSMATPHAAAFTVDSLSSYPWLQYKPHLAKAKQLAGATDEISGGDDKVGLGGIDFLSSHYNGWNYWMHGNNGDFSAWDAADGTLDGYVTRQIFIPNSYDGVRIAMSWLTRGTYTYDHKDDAHPIGMDLDLSVYDPTGGLVGVSLSYDNAFEVIDFTPVITGFYTFKINRFANRDLANQLRVGVAVNFYNE